MLRAAGQGESHVDEQTRAAHVPVTGGTDALAEALRRLDGAGIETSDIGLRRPDLDDVFLTLTGHAAEDGEPDRRAATDTPTTASAGAPSR